MSTTHEKYLAHEPVATKLEADLNVDFEDIALITRQIITIMRITQKMRNKDSDMDRKVKAFSAALKLEKSAKSKTIKCEFCDRIGHTEDLCFLNPENPKNRLSPEMLQAMSPKVLQTTTIHKLQTHKSKNQRKGNLSWLGLL